MIEKKTCYDCGHLGTWVQKIFLYQCGKYQKVFVRSDAEMPCFEASRPKPQKCPRCNSPATVVYTVNGVYFKCSEWIECIHGPTAKTEEDALYGWDKIRYER